MSGNDGEPPPAFDWEAAARRLGQQNKDADMYARHQEWLDTSWGGWAVQSLRAFASNDFFRSIADALHDDETNATAIAVKNAARLAVMLAVILMVVAISKLLQLLVGGDIVVRQNIIIEEQVRLRDLDGEVDGDDDEDDKTEEHEEAKKDK